MSAPDDRVTAAVLIIGNEVLSGRTQDKNLGFLARELNRLGVQVREARVIPDVDEVIVASVNALRERYTYVFTTGGIGPTHDDITAAAIAHAFDVPLERNAEAVRRLEDYYRRAQVPFKLNASRLRMADMPQGVRLIDNPVSQAPGFRMENVFVLAGVPSIMQAMFDGVKHSLVGGAEVRSREFVVHVPEGDMAEALGGLQQRFPDVDMGSYPFMRAGRFGTSVVLRSANVERLEFAVEEFRALAQAIGGEPEETRASDPPAV